MRILGLVCYFLILFYGVEPVAEEFTNDADSKIMQIRIDKQPYNMDIFIGNSLVNYYFNNPIIKTMQHKTQIEKLRLD